MHRPLFSLAAFGEASGFAEWAPKFAAKTTSLPPRGRTWALPALCLRRSRPKPVSDPGPGGLNSLRVRPGRRYRLPARAPGARVAALERDLLLRLDDGGLILLRDLVTVEVMAEPPVFEVGAHDLPAQVLVALALAFGGSLTLHGLIARARRLPVAQEHAVAPVLAGLRRDGLLPPAALVEWNLP